MDGWINGDKRQGIVYFYIGNIRLLDIFLKLSEIFLKKLLSRIVKKLNLPDQWTCMSPFLILVKYA
jgi:hypothetical protein